MKKLDDIFKTILVILLILGLAGLLLLGYVIGTAKDKGIEISTKKTNYATMAEVQKDIDKDLIYPEVLNDDAPISIVTNLDSLIVLETSHYKFGEAQFVKIDACPLADYTVFSSDRWYTTDNTLGNNLKLDYIRVRDSKGSVNSQDINYSIISYKIDNTSYSMLFKEKSEISNRDIAEFFGINEDSLVEVDKEFIANQFNISGDPIYIEDVLDKTEVISRDFGQYTMAFPKLSGIDLKIEVYDSEVLISLGNSKPVLKITDAKLDQESQGDEVEILSSRKNPDITLVHYKDIITTEDKEYSKYITVVTYIEDMLDTLDYSSNTTK